ncbi:helix-turn-helix domain-containing protein [Streptomyces sp. NPDC002623]
MPVRTRRPIVPSAAERVRLKKMAYGHKNEHRLRVRAQVVLHAVRGRSDACIARETALHLDTVRRWRGRLAQAGLPGLRDRQRCGRPASFAPLQAAEVKAPPACRLPVETERYAPALVVPGTGPRGRPAGHRPRSSCRRRPCVAGWPRMRSSPGSTAPGSSSPAPTSG